VQNPAEMLAKHEKRKITLVFWVHLTLKNDQNINKQQCSFFNSLLTFSGVPMDTYQYHYHDTNDTQLILFTNHQPWDLPRDRYHRTISRQAFEQPKN